uniref:Chitin-binding type-2 domain-containing protein n=1 Tax=Strongyloides papillosus TaxID=174720 RepID=A0A0N5BDH8_STREA
MFRNILIYFISIINYCFCYYNYHQPFSEGYNYDKYLDQYRDKDFYDNFQNHYKPNEYHNFRVVPLNYLCSGYSYQRFGKISLGKCNQYFMVCNFEYKSGVIESCGDGYVYDQYKGCIEISADKHCFNSEKDNNDLAIFQLAKEVKFCNQGAGIYRGYVGNNICSREVVICSEQKIPIPISCKPGFILSFNPTSQDLDNKFSCIKKRDCEFEVTNKVTPVTMEMMVRYCQIKNNEGRYDPYGIRNEKVCKNWYVTCRIDTIRELLFCPPNQIFDERIGFCRDKQFEDQCIDRKLCSKENMWKSMALGHCKEEYIYCHGEIPKIQRCSYHYVFDPYSMKCIKKKDSHLCHKHNEGYPSPPSLTKEKCKKGEDIKISCSEVLKCRHGVFEKYVCPHLTRYDKKYDTCVLDNDCKKYSHIDTCIEGELFTDSNCNHIFICKNGIFTKKHCNSKSLYPIEYGECDKCYRDKQYINDKPHHHHGMERELCNDYDKIPSPNKNQYYECYDGSWYPQTCKNNEQYDDKYKMCRYVNDNDSPHYNDKHPQIYRCIDNVSPLIPDYNDCTSFGMCLKGTYKTISCPSGSVFNPSGSIKNGDFCLKNLYCPPPISERRCNDGEKLITKHCNKYYECHHRRWKERYCSDRRYFNGQSCSKDIICPDIHNTYPAPPPIPNYPPPQDKPNYPIDKYHCHDGNLREHEKYCNRVYICIKGREVIKKCKGESVYSWVHKDCIYDTTYCGDKLICRNDEVSNTKETLDRINDPSFDKHSVDKFIKCYNNKWHLKRCKDGYIFDTFKLECIPRHSHIPYPPPHNDHCIESGGAAGYKPHEYDCTKFYQCAHGKWVEKNCGPGTGWNQKITTCDHIGKIPNCKKY